MMKALIIVLLIVSSHAQADLNDCLKDARTSGNHEHAVNPTKQCALQVKYSKDKIEARVEGFHAYGIDHMLYLEVADGSQQLMAGDQTELKKILKVQIYPEQNRILILQPDSVATYRLNFIGNVTPLYHNKHPLLNGASQVKLLEDELVIAHPESSSIVGFNAVGDSRKIGKEKPELKRRLIGSRTQLHRPVDFEFLPKQKVMVVLDEDRLLIFSVMAKGNTPPLKILNLGTEGASKLKADNELIIVQSQSKDLKVNLDQLK